VGDNLLRPSDIFEIDSLCRHTSILTISKKKVLEKRPYLKKEWCVWVLEHPVKVEKQEENRFRYWAPIEELEGKFLRVVTLEDRITIHNAFPDRSFKE